MDSYTEFIQRAIDGNALTSASAAGTAINPSIWDNRLREFQEANLVMVPLCEQFDFRGAGVDYKVTIDVAPTAASSLTETSNIGVKAFSTRNVTFTPTEYGDAYQVTQKEMNRSFFSVMERATRKLGYSLALAKDSLAISTARTGATSTVLVNAKANASLLASSDTIAYADITKAIRVMEGNLYVPESLIINHFQKQQLLVLPSINQAYAFGSRDALAKGLIGELFGVKIYASTQISNDATNTSTAIALLLGRNGAGERALGYAVKQDPMLRTFYDVLGRFTTIASHEEYDFKVLHAGAIVGLQSWSA